MNFRTEQEAIDWAEMNTPFAIKPIRESKTIFVNPFTSQHAFRQVTEHLGKRLFELQNKK